MFKRLICVAISGLISVEATDSLYFTSGSVSNYTDVRLALHGPTNLVVEVQRLNRTNDVWESKGLVTLSSLGQGTFQSTLVEGIYGFFRAKGTNNPGSTNAVIYYSTNGYGAVAGYVNPGYAGIGNIFNTQSITNIFPDAPYGTQAYKWMNASNTWKIYYLDDLSGAWEPEVPSFAETEGVLIKNNDTNTFRYLVSGLFTSESITNSIPTGLTLLSTPLYRITANNTWRVDTLGNISPGGLSHLPVQSAGFDPQCKLYKISSSALTYTTNYLNASNEWQHTGTNVSIQLGLTEAFWLEKPTNGTWVINRPLW